MMDCSVVNIQDFLRPTSLSLILGYILRVESSPKNPGHAFLKEG